MFYLYETYETLDDNKIFIVAETDVGTAYHTVQGDDGLWRYARKSDAGRVTGSCFDMTEPRNLKVPDEYAVQLKG